MLCDLLVTNALYPLQITISFNSVKADSHIPSRSHAVPLPCRPAKGLDWVFPILFTHCVNQMGKTQSKPLAGRHGRGTAFTLRTVDFSCVVSSLFFAVMVKTLNTSLLSQITIMVP